MRDWIKSFSGILGIVAGLIAMYLSGRCGGFDSGYEAAEKAFRPATGTVQFSGWLPGTYQYLAESYLSLALLFVVFAVASVAATSIISRMVWVRALSWLSCICSLVLVLRTAWVIRQMKAVGANSEFWNEPRYDVLRATAIADGFIHIIISIVVILQILLLMEFVYRHLRKTVPAEPPGCVDAGSRSCTS